MTSSLIFSDEFFECCLDYIGTCLLLPYLFDLVLRFSDRKRSVFFPDAASVHQQIPRGSVSDDVRSIGVIVTVALFSSDHVQPLSLDSLTDCQFVVLIRAQLRLMAPVLSRISYQG